MPQRRDEYSRKPPDSAETARRQPEREPGEEPNFESRVSEVNTDPDAMFDENLDPTDEPRRSDR